ncbi:MAG: hypothetical protein NTX25_03405 [Proteobacteria bacterium]|nr:hypothetical protein [Pseudomonadota bacterium]
MNTREMFKRWKEFPDVVESIEHNNKILNNARDVIGKLGEMQPYEIEDLYFDPSTDVAVKITILSLGNASLRVVRHGLTCGGVLEGKVACLHYKLSNADLKEAALKHPWRDVRDEIEKVLKKRLVRGYEGPEDLLTKNLAG